MSVAVRRAEAADLPGIRAIYNHEIRVGVATFDLEEKTAADRVAWLAAHGDRHPALVAADGGDVLGWACLNQYSDRAAYDRTVENSVYIAPLHQGRGVGSLLLGALLDEARRIGHHAILARITGGNVPSVRLHRRFGFAEVGTLREVGWKFGRWHDVLLMQLVL